MKKLLALVLCLMMMASLMPAALAEEPIVIQYWSELGGGDLQVMIDIVDEFNASQTKVRVEHASLGGDLETKLKLALGDDAAMPELFRTNVNPDYFLGMNLIQSIDPITAAYTDYDFDMADFVDSAVEKNVKDGKVYGLVTEFPLWGLWVNLDLQKEYAPNVLDDGLVTWDELFEVGAILADKRPGTAALCLGWNQNDMEFSYIEKGGELFNEDGTVQIVDAELYGEALMFPELFAAGYMWSDGENPMDKFGMGDSMFYTGGSWDLSFMRNCDFATSFMPLPVHDAAYGNLVTGGANGFMFPNKNYTTEEAWATGYFLHWFMENSIKWAESGAVISYLPVIESDAYKAMPQGPMGNVAISKFKNPTPHWGISTNVRNSFGWDVVMGYVSEADFVESWNKQTNDQIAALGQ